jgi:Rrf2 family protein
MPNSSRFAIAVHVLTLLARYPGQPVKSESLAESVNTNPVVIRRLLCALGQAGLVASQTGATGGSWLAREPEHITLAEIYRVVETGPLFALHRQQPNQMCLVGRHIEDVLSEIFRDAESAMGQVLARTTIADVTVAVGPCGMPQAEAFDVIL